jgi:hypothetical protein
MGEIDIVGSDTSKERSPGDDRTSTDNRLLSDSKVREFDRRK